MNIIFMTDYGYWGKGLVAGPHMNSCHASEKMQSATSHLSELEFLGSASVEKKHNKIASLNILIGIYRIYIPDRESFYNHNHEVYHGQMLSLFCVDIVPGIPLSQRCVNKSLQGVNSS